MYGTNAGRPSPSSSSHGATYGSTRTAGPPREQLRSQNVVPSWPTVTPPWTHQQFFGVAREAGAGGVVRHAGAGPLIEVNRIPLRAGDRRVGSRDPAQVERARDLVVPLEKAVPEVDRAHVGAPAQEVLAPLVEVAIHGREHHADAALTIAEILLRPHHGVVGGGLHRFADWARGAPRNGIEDKIGRAH